MTIAGLAQQGSSMRAMARMLGRFPCMHVSHEPICTAIFAHPRGEPRRPPVAGLRHEHSSCLARLCGRDRRGRIPELVGLHVWLLESEDRVMPGHWEVDVIKGGGNKSSVGLLVERSSGLGLLAKVDDATAASALAGFSAKLISIAVPMCHRMTYNPGREMSRCQDLTTQIGVRVCFCDPHGTWPANSPRKSVAEIRIPEDEFEYIHIQRFCCPGSKAGPFE
jgi:IS30 family transposase